MSSSLFTPPVEILVFLRDLGIDEDNLRSGCLRLGRLARLLEEHNRYYNLTGISDRTEYWYRHVLDSVLVVGFLPELGRRTLKVADIGCGGGFPLFPLACFFPCLQLTGIESTAKKVRFVKLAREELQLQNVAVLHQRAREAASAPDMQGRFEVITARAVGPSGRLFRESRRLLHDRPGSLMVFYKTPETVSVEQPELERECRKFGFRWRISSRSSLPGRRGDRQFVLVYR